jgi:hypothetical protein
MERQLHLRKHAITAAGVVKFRFWKRQMQQQEEADGATGLGTG